MKRLKTILLFLVICISCFAQNKTRTNTSTNKRTNTSTNKRTNTSTNKRTNTSTNKRVIWEYKVVIKQDGYFWDSKYQHKFPNQTAMFKEMGNEGWELASVYTEIPSIYLGEGTKLSSVTHFVFKRPKRAIWEYKVQEEEVEDQTVFQVVEKMPEFPGGMAACLKFLSNNIKYPTISQVEGVQGKVIVQFVVNKDGSIVDPVVVRSVDPYLDKEALRVISMMPKWSPGMQRGKPVRVKYTVPVTFRLQ